MIGQRDKSWGGSEKQSVLELRWRRGAVPEAASSHRKLTIADSHWTAVYVGSPAAEKRKTTSGWNRRRAGCGRIDTVAPDRAGIGKWAQPTWNSRGVPQTAASEGLAASVWRAVLIPKRSMYPSGGRYWTNLWWSIASMKLSLKTKFWFFVVRSVSQLERTFLS